MYSQFASVAAVQPEPGKKWYGTPSRLTAAESDSAPPEPTQSFWSGPGSAQLPQKSSSPSHWFQIIVSFVQLSVQRS